MTELTVTRFIAAPPAAVWDVMANRKAEWWCPMPWRAEFPVDDKRPGGRWDTTMFGPDGEVHQHNGTYLAFDDGHRFASTDAISGDLQPATPFMIGIWEIAPEGDGTRYTARARHWSEEDAKRHLDMGFMDGWGACADQLVTLAQGGRLSE